MSNIQVGASVPALELPGIDGSMFQLNSLKGKRFMLAFHRFASCPFCNLRIHTLVQSYAEFGEQFDIVAVFDSPLDNLQKHAKGHQAPFPILADASNTYYQRFGVERSLLGTLKGALLRFPTLMKAMFGKGFLPLGFKGSLTTMPLEVFVDEFGVVRYVHKGKDEGDHTSLAFVREFARNGDSMGLA